MAKKTFSRDVERLINPITVGSLHFMQYFNNFLPINIQKEIMRRSVIENSRMGFVVEPYAYFLCYEVADIEEAKKLLPKKFKLIKTSAFQGDDEKYLFIIGCFRSHTSAFWGTRAEGYLIAEDQNTGLLSWVILNYDSDTIRYDDKNGLQSPNCTPAIHSIDHRGLIDIDIETANKERRLALSADITQAKMKPLNQRLWLEGNLSIIYGPSLADSNTKPFGLTFDPLEMEKALEIDVSDYTITHNSWFPGLFKNKPVTSLCFPYAQHFITTNPGSKLNKQITDSRQLEKAVQEFDIRQVTVFSEKQFLRAIFVGSLGSFILIGILAILLILR